MTVQSEQESLMFQAEVVQILDLMVHSLYSNKEIFLRELISNASDAIDLLRLELLAQSQLPEQDGPLQIRVSYDAGAGTITVADNGIGMSRQEVIDHIGTIARSGTREFLQARTGDRGRDAELIGQFGVGFYSAFIVAERVILTTRRAGLPAGEAVRWESDGKGEYTLETIERPARGTSIVLQLREGEDDLLNGYRLRSIIQKYSDHIGVPIVMPAEAPPAQPDPGGPDAAGQHGAGLAGEITVNHAAALWARPKSEISEQDYHAFYRHISSDFADPLGYLHSKVEGTYEYTLLLFIPPRAPYDLWMPSARQGVRLHVRRVFIMADTGQLLPAYLRFIRGVVDSADLPLNVSRELLQGSRAVEHIRSSATKRVLKLLRQIAEEEPATYTTFWKEFGAVLKEGVADDYANRADIAALLRFTSTRSGSAQPDVSLAGYVARMKESQEKIYYLLAPSLADAAGSPHLEAFGQKGIEVLLLGDAVDSWVVSSLPEFEGRRLQSVTQGAPDFGALEDETEQDAIQQATTEFASLVDQIRQALGDKVHAVRVTSRLTTSPACLVAGESDSDVNLARRMRGSGLPRQPVLEVNPGHPLVARLNAGDGDPRLADWAHVLYGQAVLTLGARIEDPAGFVTRLNDLLVGLTTAAPD